MSGKCAKLHQNQSFFNFFSKNPSFDEKVFFEKDYHSTHNLEQRWKINDETKKFSGNFCFMVHLANFMLKNLNVKLS